MIRPMIAVGILAGACYLLAGGESPMKGYLHFVFGVASFYAVLQVYAHLWATKDQKALDKAESKLRRELDGLLDELRR